MTEDVLAAVRNPARLAALRGLGLLDTPTEEAFDRLARLASNILGTPVALVSLVDEDRQFCKSCQGLPEPWATWRETPLSHSFCKHVVASGEPLVITNARENPRVRGNLGISELGVIAYLGIPLITSDGHAVGSFCVIDSVPRVWTQDEVNTLQDLAASVMTEIELRKAMRQVEEASRHKSEFLANMSHELRTPLNSIMGFSEVLLDQGIGSLNEKQARYVSHIWTGGKHLLQLISDILDLSKVEAGKIDLHPESLPVADTLEDILVIVRGLAHKKGQAVEAQIEPDLPPLLADPVRFKQILFNLLSNAVKFTPGQGRITLVAKRAAASDGLELRVTDRGPGIKAEDLPRLFREFVQLETTQTKRHEGTGLGLALTKKLVGLHGGEVWAESEGEGRGSTFTVVLPFKGPKA